MTPGMTPDRISHAEQCEQSIWQRRAAAELSAVLDTGRDLPAITWTIGPAGAVLIGHISGGPATRISHVFRLWQHALALSEHHQTRDQITYLGASADRPTPGGRVLLRLTATVIHDELDDRDDDARAGAQAATGADQRARPATGEPS